MADSDQQMNLDRRIFRPDVMARAMRDSRYRHPANAIAELIDNSIDANASIVELMIQQQQELISDRKSWRINEIAVADNGIGMNATTLMEALRFGGRVPPPSRVQTIGKYGVGLPTASATQCRKFDVWSWQETIESAQHCALDIGAVEEGRLENLPLPSTAQISAQWMSRMDPKIRTSSNGTIIVWSDLREITQRPQTIFRELEQEVGRIYRHFLDDGQLSIQMKTFRGENIHSMGDPKVIRPNDPLFLMSNSATAQPWNEQPMFREYPAGKTFQFTIGEREESIHLVYSIVKAEALGDQAQNPGNLPHGKDAQRNTGVSIVREGRELVLEDVFAHVPGRREEPQNRWWGCEVRFGMGCDELLGVDHNKQMVAALSDVARRLERSDEPDDKIRIIYEDDPVYQIAEHIRATTRNMAKDIKQMFATRRRDISSDPRDASPEEKAIRIAKEALEDEIKGGKPLTETDRKRIEMPQDDRESAISIDLERDNVPNHQQRAHEIVEENRPYEFVDLNGYGSVMFTVESGPGVLYVKLNINHALYDLLSFLREQNNEQGAHEAAVAIRVLLLAWARMEDQTHDAGQRADVQDVAIRWGRVAKEVLAQVVAEAESNA